MLYTLYLYACFSERLATEFFKATYILSVPLVLFRSRSNYSMREYASKASIIRKNLSDVGYLAISLQPTNNNLFDDFQIYTIASK